ncbi:MAG: DNA repair protein RecO [Saprospiraceae bacterium]
MLTYHSQGIVFRNIKYGETSIICDIFTRELGLRSFIVSGVRSQKSKTKANVYRPLNIVEITAFEGDSEKLCRIKDIRFDTIFKQVNIHVIPSSLALFMLEIARNAIKTREADVELYDFIKDTLILLDNDSCPSPLLHHKFMIDLSIHLGFEPMQNKNVKNTIFDLLNGRFEAENISLVYRMDKEISDIFYQLLCFKLEELAPLQIPKTIRNQLLEDLIVYYKLHIPGFREILSKDILAAVL